MEKILTQEEFDKLPKAEQEALMKAYADIKTQLDAQAGKEAALPQVNMEEFRGMLKDMVKGYIDKMSPVDKKYFAFPGIGKDGMDGLEPEDKYKKTTMFFKALVQGETKDLNKMHAEVNTKANLSSGDSTAGGFLVPEEFTNEILRLMPTYGVIRRECRIFPMKSDVKKIPKAGTTELTAQWVGEGGQIKSTDPNFGQALLSVRKLGAIPKVTSELLDDADADIISYLAMLIAEAFAKEEDSQGFSGSGSPFIGILNGTGFPTSPHASGTGFITLSYQDLVTATGELYDNALENAKFYFHRTMIAHIRGLITTAGAPIFNATAKEVAGYPLVSAESLPGIRHANAKVDATKYAIFGNLRRALALGDRKAITMKLSTEATVGADNLFEQDMVALRAIERIAQAVLIPSACVLIRP